MPSLVFLCRHSIWLIFNAIELPQLLQILLVVPRHARTDKMDAEVDALNILLTTLPQEYPSAPEQAYRANLSMNQRYVLKVI